MPVTTLTEISIRHLRPPEEGQAIYTDRSFKGFGVRLTPGSKTYVLTYGSERKRITLGDVSAVSLKDAREKARVILHGPKDKPSPTFKAALDAFLTLHVRQNNRLSTAKETERLLTTHFTPLYQRPIASLAAGDFLAITDALMTKGTPSTANHTFTALRTLLRWSVARGYLTHTPIEGARKPARAISRDRVLSDPEIAQTLRTAAYTGLYGVIIQLLILTGQRRGQISHFDQRWIEGETVRFPASIMKSAREHLIPIGPWTATLLPQLAYYGNWGNGHRSFLEKSGVPHFTRHDLRRTFSTGLARLGTAPHIIERLLDHQSGTISGVAAIYNRHHFLPEMRDAVEKWEAHLSKLVNGS